MFAPRLKEILSRVTCVAVLRWRPAIVVISLREMPGQPPRLAVPLSGG